MLSEERQGIILREIVERGILKVEELVILTKSSESTIRRDLSYLEEKGKIKRVHGGAILNKEVNVEEDFEEEAIKETRKETVDKNMEKENIEKPPRDIKQERDNKTVADKELSGKILIAKFAASLIKEGDSIYLDSGELIFEMTKYIDTKDIFVVTNGVDNVEALLEKDIDVYILGGKIKAKTKAVVGTNTFNELEKFRFDKAFIAIDGIDIEFGLTTPDQEEAMMKTKAIEISRDSFVLADSDKFNRVSFTKVSDFREVTVITDEENRQYERRLNLKIVN